MGRSDDLLRMALAEAGYPNPTLTPTTLRGVPSRRAWDVPFPVFYKACRMSYEHDTGKQYPVCEACGWLSLPCEEHSHAEECDGYGWGTPDPTSADEVVDEPRPT